MALNYGNLQLRKNIVDEILSNNNKIQKNDSLKQFEIFRGRLLPYVKQYLQGMLSNDTVNEMPIVSSINLAKRVVKSTATLYQECPVRTFTGLTEEQTQVLEQVYEDMDIDQKMQKANEAYKLQDQTHIQVVPQDGKLYLRCLMRHHLDAVPSPMNPEMADAYIVNGFDRSMFVPRLSQSEDAANQTIADPEDYKSQTTKFALWSDEFNFIMNENGSIISGPDVSNPIGMKPFVDIAGYKDYEYFNRLDMSIVDFAVQLNAAMSDLGQIVRMQGFAQAFLKCAESMIPQNIQVGPNYIIKLPIDPNNPVETDFGFASPSPDLAGSISYIETLLSTFLSSIGLDPKIVSGKGDAQKFNSGIERLLSMLERFEATRSDMELFEQAERKLFKIVVQYLNTYSGTDILKYKISTIPEDADVEIEFKKPEMVQTESEKIQSIRDKIELNLITQTEAIMMDRNVSEEAAIEIKKQIDAESQQQLQSMNQQDVSNGEDNRDESIS
jgi:hypothetical protein